MHEAHNTKILIIMSSGGNDDTACAALRDMRNTYKRQDKQKKLQDRRLHKMWGAPEGVNNVGGHKIEAGNLEGSDERSIKRYSIREGLHGCQSFH